MLRTFLARLRSLRRQSRHEDDLDDELRAYVDTLTEQHERRGLPPEAARRAALVDAGGTEQIKERVREVRVGFSLATAVRDARHGCRVLWQSPGYALVVILTIALGIGINVTIFSVIHAVLWRSLPYPDADRIVAIEADTRGLPNAYSPSRETFDLRQVSHVITNIAAVEGRDASVTIDGVMERVAGARVTDDVLPLLGATPLALGRTIVDAQDAHDVVIKGVVISHELWQRRFQGDPGIIGRHLTVNNWDVEVVGVTRPDFRVYLPPRDQVEERVDVWMPIQFQPTWLSRGSTLVGRLVPGATVAEAQAECDARRRLRRAASRHLSGQPAACLDPPVE